MDTSQFNANWNYPTTIKNGIGSIKELPVACLALGIKAPLIVTDPALALLPMIKKALQHCVKHGLKCGLFSDIKSNPNGENINAGVYQFQQGNYDGIIGFGGGSAIDAAKAIALMVGQQRPLWDFEDVGDNWTRVLTKGMAPVIAVPTTAGTGSEVGRASVITDDAQQVKRIIFHKNMLPDLVILDAELTVGLPPKLTAATGMDALSHALEAFCASYYHPMAEGIAIEAIRLVKQYLPIATSNGEDLTARTQMMVASTMGATAFQRGLGAMHALAHPLGAIYDSHHALLNAILMPYVLKCNQVAIEERISRLSRYLELEDASFNGFLQWILHLRSELNIPNKLSDIGINADKAELIGQMAYNDPSSTGNPINLSAKEYSQLFIHAVNGNLL